MNRIKANFDEVICPNCVAQFRAIPVNVQQDLARLSAIADKWNLECDELLEDNKRLAAERDALREDSELWSTEAAARQATADRLTAERDSLLADAKRYQWLRNGNDCKNSHAMFIAVDHYGLEWDDLIDAEMKGSAS